MSPRSSRPSIRLPRKQDAKAKPNARNSLNQVRIIGGQFKRRQVSFVEADGLRPTPDRVRETVFNWLQGYLHEARVLDACAGSGVMGFEALSRGAGSVVMIEPNPHQFKQLAHTADQLDINYASHHAKRLEPKNQLQSPAPLTLLQGNAETLIPSLSGSILAEPSSTLPFDLVFVDPPYAMDLWQPILQSLFDSQQLNQNALVYLEADKPIEQLPMDAKLLSKFELLKQKKMGQVVGHLLQLA